MQAQKLKNISECLPHIRGRYTEDAPLGRNSWFRTGGSAQILFKPADKEDLLFFLENCPEDVPVQLFGVLSNTIVRDGGVPGVTIRLGKEFSSVKTEGNCIVAGAAALDSTVAKVAAQEGVGGLTFLSGIPGSIGGAVRMNAGCYGAETKDVLVGCHAVYRNGIECDFTPDKMGMRYRHNDLGEDVFFLKAILQGERQDPENISRHIEEIKERRENSQPIREKTGGSTFANPSAEELEKAKLPETTKVWELIDRVGGRGLQVGGAQMSEKHCNFMINTGDATSGDLEALGEEIRKRVGEELGITLRWEIKRIGLY